MITISSTLKPSQSHKKYRKNHQNPITNVLPYNPAYQKRKKNENERVSPQETRAKADVVTHPSGCSRVIRWPTINKYGRSSTSSSVRSVCRLWQESPLSCAKVCRDVFVATEHGHVEGLRDGDGGVVVGRDWSRCFDRFGAKR